MTSETRVVECLKPKPEVAPLDAAQVYTTYGRLKQFLITEVERLMPGRISFHAKHRLEVDLLKLTLTSSMWVAFLCCMVGFLDVTEHTLCALQHPNCHPVCMAS